jgi:ABC-type transport system substrate-binding protein
VTPSDREAVATAREHGGARFGVDHLEVDVEPRARRHRGETRATKCCDSPRDPTRTSSACDRRVDAAIARAAGEQDSAAATASWQEVEKAVLAQAPVVPAFNGSSVDFVSERVGNYEYNPQWGPLLAQVWVR